MVALIALVLLIASWVRALMLATIPTPLDFAAWAIACWLILPSFL